jgi:CDP-glucose 4,6-dehydratase
MDLVSQMSLYWEKVRWNDLSGPLGEKHESGLLKLNCDKSLQFLSWHAVMDFELTIKMTAEWYKSYYKKSETTNLLTVRQIEMYTQIAQKNGLTWAQ